jgi:hypothetical protein
MNYLELRKVQLLSRKVRDQVISSNSDSIYGVASDGIPICRKCCRTERMSIGFTYGDGWDLVGAQENYEDSELLCGHCGDQIDPVYA